MEKTNREEKIKRQKNEANEMMKKILTHRFVNNVSWRLSSS